MFGNANQCSGWSPLLHEVVPIPSPTKLPSRPYCAISGSSPTITSGPATSVGASAPAAPACASLLGDRPRSGGLIADRDAALTMVVTTVGCIVAAIEIEPAIAPASDGRPRALANSCETIRCPPVTLRDCALRS